MSLCPLLTLLCNTSARLGEADFNHKLAIQKRIEYCSGFFLLTFLTTIFFTSKYKCINVLDFCCSRQFIWSLNNDSYTYCTLYSIIIRSCSLYPHFFMHAFWWHEFLRLLFALFFTYFTVSRNLWPCFFTILILLARYSNVNLHMTKEIFWFAKKKLCGVIDTADIFSQILRDRFYKISTLFFRVSN